MSDSNGEIPITVLSHYCSNYMCNNKVAWQDTPEVAWPARTVHRPKPHSTRLNIQSRSRMCLELQSLSKGRLRFQAKVLDSRDSDSIPLKVMVRYVHSYSIYRCKIHFHVRIHQKLNNSSYRQFSLKFIGQGQRSTKFDHFTISMLLKQQPSHKHGRWHR